jgi:hypothetical protein
VVFNCFRVKCARSDYCLVWCSTALDFRVKCARSCGRKAPKTIKPVNLDTRLCIWRVMPIKNSRFCSCQSQGMNGVFSWTDNRESVFPKRYKLTFYIKITFNFTFWITFRIERFFLVCLTSRSTTFLNSQSCGVGLSTAITFSSHICQYVASSAPAAGIRLIAFRVHNLQDMTVTDAITHRTGIK